MSLIDLNGANSNLQAAQAKMNCYPSCVVTIVTPVMEFVMDLAKDFSEVPGALKCHLPEDLLRRIINREEHWNNAELGCHIEFDRVGPYMPDVHMLLCFFHLPRTPS